jgi:hypothetical protein
VVGPCESAKLLQCLKVRTNSSVPNHLNTSATPGVRTLFCWLRKIVDVELNLCFAIFPSFGLGSEPEEERERLTLVS